MRVVYFFCACILFMGSSVSAGLKGNHDSDADIQSGEDDASASSSSTNDDSAVSIPWVVGDFPDFRSDIDDKFMVKNDKKIAHIVSQLSFFLQHSLCINNEFVFLGSINANEAKEFMRAKTLKKAEVLGLLRAKNSMQYVIAALKEKNAVNITKANFFVTLSDTRYPLEANSSVVCAHNWSW